MANGTQLRIMITGANRGLGLSVARALARQGHALIVTARDEIKARNVARVLHKDNASLEVASRVLDLASLASVRKSAEWIAGRDKPIDIMLHNAGMLFPPPTCTLTDAGVEQTLQVHAVAPLLLSHRLRASMARPSRTWTVGSSLHLPGSRGPEVDFRHEDPNLEKGYHPQVAYKNTKLAALWVAYEWERRFGGDGLHADVLSPGFVPTTAAEGAGTWLRRLSLKHVLPHMPFATSVEEATDEIVTLLTTTPMAEPGGRYFRRGQAAASSPQSLDTAQAARFWNWACSRAGIDTDATHGGGHEGTSDSFRGSM